MLNGQFPLKITFDNFIAGKTKLHLNNWYKLTNDKWVLQTICGYHVELNRVTTQKYVPKPLRFDKTEQAKIAMEINRFLQCQIIEEVHSYMDSDMSISQTFLLVPKKDGTIRIILNLKAFNSDFMQNIHFKMETLKHAVDSMRKNCYFASMDISRVERKTSVSQMVVFPQT